MRLFKDIISRILILLTINFSIISEILDMSFLIATEYDIMRNVIYSHVKQRSDDGQVNTEMLITTNGELPHLQLLQGGNQ